MLELPKSELIADKIITISGSKSESNRILILQKLFGNITFENISNAEDTNILQNALNSNKKLININNAGTAMRFLTSFFAIQEEKEIILTGSARMKKRPIKPLVTALRNIGADIQYIENEGFPPLKIIGKKLIHNFVEIPAYISSQFITSLLLIGAKLDNGLKIKLLGKIASLPYLKMSLNMLSKVGIEANLKNNIITITPFSAKKSHYCIESDWSSASYTYSIAAIGRKSIYLKNFKKKSSQGDAMLVNFYRDFFGIKTIFQQNNTIKIAPIQNFILPNKIELNMNKYPDIVQTMCVTAAALKIHFHFSGLETLKIKETDRIIALQNELLKIGVKTKITNNEIYSIEFIPIKKNIEIKTYKDHRMAMSFAPFSLISDIKIKNHNVVKKSYPNFWKDFNNIIKN